jgi:hypothetical protein
MGSALSGFAGGLAGGALGAGYSSSFGHEASGKDSEE